MRIIDYIKEEWIVPDLEGRDKVSVLRELANLVAGSFQGNSTEYLLQALMEREGLESTAIGDGVAIPHARLNKCKDFVVAFGRSKQGVDFDSIDRKPTHLFFLVVAPENSPVDNLKVIGRIVTLVKDSSFRKRLKEAKTRKEIFECIAEEDAKY